MRLHNWLEIGTSERLLSTRIGRSTTNFEGSIPFTRSNFSLTRRTDRAGWPKLKNARAVRTMKMKLYRLFTVLIILAIAPEASAADVNGYLVLTSDYVYRGVCASYKSILSGLPIVFMMQTTAMST